MATKKRKSKKRTSQKSAGATTPQPSPAGQVSPAQRITTPGVDAGAPPVEQASAGTAGVALTAETVDVTPDADDRKLLAESLETLADAGFTPRRDIAFEDVVADSSCGMSRFRRYPLVSLLGLRDLDEEQLFERVYYDHSALQRTAPQELLELISAYARAAGTAEQVGDVNLLLDPGSTTSGSFRFTNGDRVNDVAFDLDTDFGDEEAEMQIALDVSPEGYEPQILFAGDTARPVVLWAPVGADLSSLDVVLEEGA